MVAVVLALQDAQEERVAFQADRDGRDLVEDRLDRRTGSSPVIAPIARRLFWFDGKNDKKYRATFLLFRQKCKRFLRRILFLIRI